MKLKLIIYFLCFVPTILNSQVYYSELSTEFYFGPKNVYPISKSICEIYISYLTKEFEKIENLDSKKEDTELKNLKLLIESWTSVESNLEEYNGIQNLCYKHSLDEEEYGKFQLELEIIEEDGSLNTIEYIDRTKSKLATSRWEKRKADKNCLSSDPNDCLVWCLIEYENVYLDSEENVIGDENLLNELDFVLDSEENRWERETELMCEFEFTYKFRNLASEKYYSILDLEIVDCKE